MSVRRLDEVCSIVMGQAPGGDSYNNKGEGLPLIAGAGDFGDEHLEPSKFTTKPTKICAPGDFVLGIRATIGVRGLADRHACLGRGVAGLRPKDKLHPRFLWHWLGFSAPALAAKAKGATFKQVNRDDIGSLLIDLPPLYEQARIAAALDLAHALRAKRRAALALLGPLGDAVFAGLFGSWGRMVGTEMVAISDVAEVQGGLALSKARSALPLEVPYLRVANVRRGSIDLSEVKTIRAAQSEILKTRLREGDLLVVEGHGNPAEIGRVAVWDGSIADCVHQNHLIRVRFDRDRVLPRYAEAFLNSPEGRRHLLRAGKTTSGLNTVSVSDVRRTPLSVPPLQTQQTFIDRMRLLDEVREVARRHLSALDALFASLQHRAFNGTLFSDPQIAEEP